MFFITKTFYDHVLVLVICFSCLICDYDAIILWLHDYTLAVIYELTTIDYAHFYSSSKERNYSMFYLKIFITLKNIISANVILCQVCHILYMFEFLHFNDIIFIKKM